MYLYSVCNLCLCISRVIWGTCRYPFLSDLVAMGMVSVLCMRRVYCIYSQCMQSYYIK